MRLEAPLCVEAEDAEKEELRREVARLQSEYESVCQKLENLELLFMKTECREPASEERDSQTVSKVY